MFYVYLLKSSACQVYIFMKSVHIRTVRPVLLGYVVLTSTVHVYVIKNTECPVFFVQGAVLAPLASNVHCLFALRSIMLCVFSCMWHSAMSSP